MLVPHLLLLLASKSVWNMWLSPGHPKCAIRILWTRTCLNQEERKDSGVIHPKGPDIQRSRDTEHPAGPRCSQWEGSDLPWELSTSFCTCACVPTSEMSLLPRGPPNTPLPPPCDVGP